MHEIERNRSQKLGCQANGGARAGRAPLDPPMLKEAQKKISDGVNFYEYFLDVVGEGTPPTFSYLGILLSQLSG